MAPAADQATCKGLLVFEQASGGAYTSTCYGLNSTLPPSAALDLDAHHEATRKPHMQPAEGAEGVGASSLMQSLHMHSLTCFGVSTYQQHPSTPQGDVPPPLCLGVEALRYGQAVMKHRHTHPASGSSHLPTLPDTAEELPGLPLPQYHQHSAHHQHQQQQQQQHLSVAEPHTGSSNRRPSLDTANEQQQQPPSLFGRLQAAQREASERLEGQDPWWFAKAFTHRAQLNAASMRRMAGQLLDAARSDLGLGPEQSDEERSP